MEQLYPKKVYTNCGALKFKIQNVLENALHISDISKLLFLTNANLQYFATEVYIDEKSNEEKGRPIFHPLAHGITDQCRLELEPPRHTINFGIYHYLKCLEIIE